MSITMGIDLGSRSAKAVLFDADTGHVLGAKVRDTSTNSKQDSEQLLSEILAYSGMKLTDIERIISTGYGRAMVQFASDTSTEITCHAIGVHSIYPDVRTIIDIGGQDSKSIHLGDDGLIRDFSMNDRCAAGTGRFLEVVAKILGTDVDGMSRMAEKAVNVPEISSMCVVFAESEVIGMLARGVSPVDLAAGIHKSIARRVAGLAERGRLESPVAFTGGVAKDKAMVRALGQELHEMLIIPPDPRLTGALGAAIMAARHLGKDAVLRNPYEIFERIKDQEALELSVEGKKPEEKPSMPIYYNTLDADSDIEIDSKEPAIIRIDGKQRSEKANADNTPCQTGGKQMTNGNDKAKEACCGGSTHESNQEQTYPCCSVNLNKDKKTESCCDEKKSDCCGEEKQDNTCCCESEKEIKDDSPCCSSETCEESNPSPSCVSESAKPPSVKGGFHNAPSLSHFDRMIPDAIDRARQAKKEGKKVVSIFCEYTPRELILAAGAIPVCACGGSHSMAVASEKELPANLCPLIKSSYGYYLEKANPIFNDSDMIVAETTCDGKKKMYELFARDKNVHILELTQKPDEQMAFDHWLHEIRKLKTALEELTGNEITNEKLWEAIRVMNKERRLRREIATFAGKGLTGMEVLHAKSIIACQDDDFEAYEKIIEESKKLSENTNKPRILLTGVPLPHGAEKVLKLIEEAGAIVVAQENCTGLKPILDDVSEVGDPLYNIAIKYFQLPCSVMMPNKKRFELLDRLIAEYKADGVVDLVWQACHTYNIESVLIKKHISEKHKIPFLKIETDYSPSDTEQLRLRIEAFLSVAKQKHEQRKTH